MRFFIVAAFMAGSYAVHLRAGDMQPDFGKLAPVPLCAAAVEAARTNSIPIDRIDPPGEAGNLNPGDSVTALVTLFEKRGQKSQWLLYVEAVEPTMEEKARKPKAPAICYVGAGDKMEFARSPVPLSLRLLGPFVDATNKAPKVEDQKARITLDKGFLGIGLEQAAAAFSRMRQNKLHGSFHIRPRPFTEEEAAEGKKGIVVLKLSAEEQRAIAGSQFAFMSYVQLVQETPGLDGLFYKVVRLPSVWSVVRHFGVNASLELQKEHVAPADGRAALLRGQAAPQRRPIEQTPCYTFPLALRINGQPGLMATMVVAPARPPLLQCGGIVGLLAEKPGDPKTYLILRIISARYGKKVES